MSVPIFVTNLVNVKCSDCDATMDRGVIVSEPDLPFVDLKSRLFAHCTGCLKLSWSLPLILPLERSLPVELNSDIS